MMYLFTTFINFIVGAGLTLLFAIIITLVRFALYNKKHLTQDQVNAAVNDIAQYGMCVCETVVHAMDIVAACPVKTRIQRVNDKQYNIREVKE